MTWRTATCGSGAWCPAYRSTAGSARWRSCSTSSTTSWICSWHWTRTPRCSSGLPRSSPPPPPLHAPRWRTSTLTRLLLLSTSRGTASCAAEPLLPGGVCSQGRARGAGRARARLTKTRKEGRRLLTMRMNRSTRILSILPKKPIPSITASEERRLLIHLV